LNLHGLILLVRDDRSGAAPGRGADAGKPGAPDSERLWS